MDNRLMVNQPVQPGRKVNTDKQKTGKKTQKQNGASFKEILSKQIKKKDGIKFSRHAQNRLISREIDLTDRDLSLLKNGLEKLEDKGARESLVMVNQVAYVVSVENKTVITAIDNDSIKDNVFTNIDSAVFM